MARMRKKNKERQQTRGEKRFKTGKREKEIEREGGSRTVC